MPQLVPGVEVKAGSLHDEDSGHTLIAHLIHLFETKAKLNGDKKATVKCTTLRVPEHPSALLRSWKFNEFSYGKPDKPLPSDARGLFSYTNPTTGKHSIVLRGYDKFFNTDEVALTKWKHIEDSTCGPYDLTLKQNGCIIFIGALDATTLLVSSKHSIGPRADMAQSHSERGKQWLRKHLEAAGRSELELTSLLYRYKITAVCELCDDEFEEHILGYPPETAGLHLHGLNVNTTSFSTYPIKQVNLFAAYFGFYSNSSVTIHDSNALKAFLAECAKTGTYQNTEVEGFVIRTKMNDSDFFFKYKFDEPYLLYRQWREVTKALIAGREPQFRLHQKLTKQYIQFVLPIIKDAAVATRFTENHGIIALRERFLASRGTEPLLNDETSSENDRNAPDLQNARIVLVPVATIGCGKTTVALALRRLFGFGHVQNDNILAKKSSSLFAKNIYDSFTGDKTRVVYADRNNHMFHERQSLVRDISALRKTVDPPVYFLALSFHQSPEIREITVDRVLKRGDNHQSIRAATMGVDEIKNIMDGFHRRFQELNVSQGPDSAFFDTVSVDPRNGSRENLEIVCNFLLDKGIIEAMPSTKALDAALEYAINYKPSVYKLVTSHASEGKLEKQDSNVSKQRAKDRPNKKSELGEKRKDVLKRPTKDQTNKVAKKTNFFGLRILDETSLVNKVESVLQRNPGSASFWQSLRSAERIQDELHVTLIHQSRKTSNAMIWEHYTTLVESEASLPSQPKYMIELQSVVFDDRVMAIAVKIPDMPCTNMYAHITLGTVNSTIKPVESNTMLAKSESKLTRIAINETVECVLKAY